MLTTKLMKSEKKIKQFEKDDEFEISVRTSVGRDFLIRVRSNMTVRDLKRKVYQLEGHSMKNQTYYY